jgi:microsomal dipeptidase-like Zn-dependent dipeptidase
VEAVTDSVEVSAPHLSAGGFTDTEVDRIMGENFLRVLEQVKP